MKTRLNWLFEMVQQTVYCVKEMSLRDFISESCVLLPIRLIVQFLRRTDKYIINKAGKKYDKLILSNTSIVYQYCDDVNVLIYCCTIYSFIAG